jgi:hypothetical protein
MRSHHVVSIRAHKNNLALLPLSAAGNRVDRVSSHEPLLANACAGSVPIQMFANLERNRVGWGQYPVWYPVIPP